MTCREILAMWLWLSAAFGLLGVFAASAHYWPGPTAGVAAAIVFWGARRTLREGQP